jgi:hypothetical protein
MRRDELADLTVFLAVAEERRCHLCDPSRRQLSPAMTLLVRTLRYRPPRAALQAR